MLTVGILLLVGFGLLIAEAFLPGGVTGLLGGLFIVIAVILAFTKFVLPLAILTALIALTGSMVSVGLGLKMFPHTPMGRAMILKDAVTPADGRDSNRNELVGSSGIALTHLAPVGKVDIQGKPFEASAYAGYIDRGSNVTVISVESFRLVVKPA